MLPNSGTDNIYRYSNMNPDLTDVSSCQSSKQAFSTDEDERISPVTVSTSQLSPPLLHPNNESRADLLNQIKEKIKERNLKKVEQTSPSTSKIATTANAQFPQKTNTNQDTFKTNLNEQQESFGKIEIQELRASIDEQLKYIKNSDGIFESNLKYLKSILGLLEYLFENKKNIEILFASFFPKNNEIIKQLIDDANGWYKFLSFLIQGGFYFSEFIVNEFPRKNDFKNKINAKIEQISKNNTPSQKEEFSKEEKRACDLRTKIEESKQKSWNKFLSTLASYGSKDLGKKIKFFPLPEIWQNVIQSKTAEEIIKCIHKLIKITNRLWECYEKHTVNVKWSHELHSVKEMTTDKNKIGSRTLKILKKALLSKIKIEHQFLKFQFFEHLFDFLITLIRLSFCYQTFKSSAIGLFGKKIIDLLLFDISKIHPIFELFNVFIFLYPKLKLKIFSLIMCVAKQLILFTIKPNEYGSKGFRLHIYLRTINFSYSLYSLFSCFFESKANQKARNEIFEARIKKITEKLNKEKTKDLNKSILKKDEITEILNELKGVTAEELPEELKQFFSAHLNFKLTDENKGETLEKHLNDFLNKECNDFFNSYSSLS